MNIFESIDKLVRNMDDETFERQVRQWREMRTPTAAAAVPAGVDAWKGNIEFAIDCLSRNIDACDPECTCEPCPSCGLLPNECSGTECASTCQCRLCDHCRATDAIDGLRSLTAPAPRGGVTVDLVRKQLDEAAMIAATQLEGDVARRFMAEWQKGLARLTALRDYLFAMQRRDGACTMGVGDGSGKLFVHGDYDSIKATQAIVLEREELRRQLAASERTCAELRASIEQAVSVQSVRIVDENAKLRAALRIFVPDDEVCPTLVTFSDGSVVRLAHDADRGYYLQVETTEE